MAIAFTAGTSTESTASQTSTTVTLPAGIAAGDYTIIFISVNASSASITTPSGWTNILASTNSVNGSTSMAHAIFYRRWVSGDSNPVISHSNGRVGATPVKVSGADATTFVNTTGAVTQAASGAVTIVAPTITPTSTVMVCSFTGRDANNGDVLDPWSNLSSGLTKIAEGNGRATNATNAGHCIAWATVTSGAATGTKQADAVQATTGAFGVSFALNEAAGGANFNASAALSGAGTLTGVNQTPGFIRTPDLSGSGTVAGVGVYGSPSTSFDDGTLQDWTSAVLGSGTVQVLTEAKHDGTHGVRVTTPADTVDAASISKTLPAIPKARIAGWYRVTTEGLSSTNVSFARFMNGSTILAGMYRQNVTAGPNVWLRTAKADGTGFYFTGTGFRMDLDQWVYIEFEWDQVTGTPLVKVNGTTYINTAATDHLAATTIDGIVIGSPETGKAGLWDADTLQVNTYQDAINPSGSGTLAPVVKPGFSAAPALSGSGTLTSTVVSGKAVTAPLSGAGGLTSTVVPAVAITVNMSGGSSLGVTQDNVAQSRAVPLSSTGTLSRTVVANFSASMSSSSTGTLAPTVGGLSFQVSAAFTGSGTLAGAQSAVTATRTVALSGSGTLSRTVTPAFALTKQFSGEGTLIGVLANSFSRTANLSGTGGLVGTITNVTKSVSAALSGSGSLVGSGSNNKSVSVNLSSSGLLQPFVTSMGTAQSVNLSGSGTLTGSAIITRLAFPQYSGVGGLSASVTPGFNVSFNQLGTSLLTVDHVPAMAVTASLGGSGTLTAELDEMHNATVLATLPPKRWNSSLGTQRWKGYL